MVTVPKWVPTTFSARSRKRKSPEPMPRKVGKVEEFVYVTIGLLNFLRIQHLRRGRGSDRGPRPLVKGLELAGHTLAGLQSGVAWQEIKVVVGIQLVSIGFLWFRQSSPPGAQAFLRLELGAIFADHCEGWGIGKVCRALGR